MGAVLREELAHGLQVRCPVDADVDCLGTQVIAQACNSLGRSASRLTFVEKMQDQPQRMSQGGIMAFVKGHACCVVRVEKTPLWDHQAAPGVHMAAENRDRTIDWYHVVPADAIGQFPYFGSQGVDGA